MKMYALCGFILCVGNLPGVPAKCDTPRQSPAAQRSAPAPFVEAGYGYSAETTCRRIVVKGGKLRYTYNAQNSKIKPGERMMRQEPYYTDKDLVTKEVALTPAELSALAKLIRTSGFLELKPVYDDRPRERAYPIRAMGAVQGARKAVDVRHGPAPKAFHTLTDALFKLVTSHFPAAPTPI